MNKGLKILLISFVLSLPFWWGINVFEKNLEFIFYWKEMTENPKVLAAQANLEMLQAEFKNLPVRNKNVEGLRIEAESAISVFLSSKGKEKILFEKDNEEVLPIASLTKLMTAKIILENYNLSKEIKISKEAVLQEENLGKLKVDETLSIKYLLYPLLMESSNDAAYALSNDYEGMTGEKFVEMMNLEAQKLGLKNTYFSNPTGLDPDDPGGEINYSTIIDLVKLTKELLKSQLIWGILSTPKFNLYGPELINSNKLLSKIPGIIGGKTGYTEKALGCFLLVLEAPKGKGYLINIILGSKDRFSEMEKLIEWTKKAYKW